MRYVVALSLLLGACQPIDRAEVCAREPGEPLKACLLDSLESIPETALAAAISPVWNACYKEHAKPEPKPVVAPAPQPEAAK